MKRAEFCVLVLLYLCSYATGQTYQVLYNFGTTNGLADGNYPNQGLVADDAGNLYGTTNAGGAVGGTGFWACTSGCGTIFELSLGSGGTWTETVLYDFCTTLNNQTCSDGYAPVGGLVRDKLGNLYGTVAEGPNLGNVFELSPPSVQGSSWTYSVLWTTQGLEDEYPLALDSSGNLYGTTSLSGAYGWGSVFELSPPLNSGGSWTVSTLNSFCPGGPFDCPDGDGPAASVILDSSGNVYGINGGEGAPNYGTVYELSPSQDGNWQETLLHVFTTDQFHVGVAGLALDQAGDIYGTASLGGKYGGSYCKVAPHYATCGAVFELIKKNNWVVRGFGFDGPDGGVPDNGVYIGGNNQTIYGTTELGGLNKLGTIYQIHGESESVLYNFCSKPNCADGYEPSQGGSLTEIKGSLFGTTPVGGADNQGVVFELTP